MTLHAAILDMCCGSRMFWFDKKDDRAIFSDIRKEEHTLCDGRRLIISPDLIADFRALPFADASFPIVVFDPPHLERVGDNAWMGKKYGRLNKDTWRDDLRQGFKEAFRVLWPYGVLIFKWNETQIPVRQILALTDRKPVIGQRTGKGDKTHWIIFMKGGQPVSEINYQELRVELGAAKKRIEELEANRVVLEVENERLKHAMAVALEHISVTDAGQAGVAAMIIYDAMYHSEKTDPYAFLAELRAQGVEMVREHPAIKLCSLTHICDELVAELRKGGNK